MNIIQSPSPNFDNRPEDMLINTLVLHYTGMSSAKDALDRLCDINAKVSSHYMVEEDGEIHQLVHENKRAWHAGISCWHGRASVNDFSIGIEIVNPGHEWGYRTFPEIQMESVIELCKAILSRHHIPANNVVGHSDVAPNRKEDPGELFDWKWLANEGIGLWPEGVVIKNPAKVIITPGEESTAVASVQKMLADYGYHIRVDGYYGWKTESVIKAFKRHFVQHNVNSIWDNECDVRMARLLQLL